MTQATKSSGTPVKVLHVAVVERQKIVQEEKQSKPGPLRIGSGAKADLRVSSEIVGEEFGLFSHEGGRYALHFCDGMEGRIQLAGEQVQSFDELKSTGKAQAHRGGHRVVLSDESRGRVMVGETTFLFKFQPLAAAEPPPALPPGLKGGALLNLDRQFWAILVVVAASVVSFVSYARSVPYIAPSSIEEISEKFQRLIVPDIVPAPEQSPAQKEEADPGKADKKKEEKKVAKEKAKKKDDKKPAPKAKADVDPEAAARARKAAIRKKVAGKGLLGVLGAKRGGGSAVADIFSEGGGDDELGSAFSGIQGVELADGSARGTRGGGAGKGAGIGELGTAGGGNVKTGTKREAAVSGRATAETPEVDGELSQAELSRVMRRQLKALRGCYESALKRNRKLSGKLVIQFEITEAGRTSAVEFDDVSLGSRDVEKCIRRRMRFWRFPKPKGGSVFVSYPIVFAPSS